MAEQEQRIVYGKFRRGRLVVGLRPDFDPSEEAIAGVNVLAYKDVEPGDPQLENMLARSVMHALSIHASENGLAASHVDVILRLVVPNDSQA